MGRSLNSEIQQYAPIDMPFVRLLVRTRCMRGLEDRCATVSMHHFHLVTPEQRCRSGKQRLGNRLTHKACLFSICLNTNAPFLFAQHTPSIHPASARSNFIYQFVHYSPFGRKRQHARAGVGLRNLLSIPGHRIHAAGNARWSPS